MLDLRKLLLLRELHARGTVAAVAEALAYTPSAVSQQLSQLQKEAGVALTERVGRRLQLTDAGLRLVEHADALLARIEQAEAELQATAGAIHGRLRLSGLQTPMLSLVPPAVARLAREHPRLRIEVVEREPEQALPDLALGQLDLVVAEEYDDAPRRPIPALTREELCRDGIVVALPLGHPLAGAGTVRVEALAHEPWVAPHRGTAFTDAFVRTCRRLGGFEPDVQHRANDIAVILELVAFGGGVAMVPGLARADRDPRVHVSEIAGAQLGRTIYAYAREAGAPRPAVRATIDALQEAAYAMSEVTRTARSALSSRGGPDA